MDAAAAALQQTVDEVMNEFEERTLNDADAEIFGAYAWEKEVERSWDALVELDGVLECKQNESEQFKRNYLHSGHSHALQQIRKGMIRNMVIIFDMSASMRDMDFRPDRLECALQACQEFIREFFFQNPISNMGIVIMRNMNAEIVQSLSSNPDEQISKLHSCKRQDTSGAPSLQNGIEQAISLLESIPPYGTREIVIIYGSLRSCDAGPIEHTVAKLESNHIRVSVVSMSPEIYILKKICKDTDGAFGVALNKAHFRDLLLIHTHPPPWVEGMQPTLVRMGFPRVKQTSIAALCVCHQKLTYSGYICPQCGAKLCRIPTRCKCCFVNLISPADISRTFHHLFPPSRFEQLINLKTSDEPYKCLACSLSFRKGGSKCLECGSIFCYDCDVYTHELLHHCPFCVMQDVQLEDASIPP